MRYAEVLLKDIAVNRANDRHGEVMDEESAMLWLLTHRAKHMRNLAKDIVECGQIYEPPLVREEAGQYVVYDGNRRATVLKLLNQPEIAPTKDWADFFSSMRQKWEGQFPQKIACQIEQDRERLDEILYRRHTGQQNGIGQSQWDRPAITNFERRTGKNTKIDLAESIENLLIQDGRLQKSERIPRSNLKRLLSAEQFRNRAGVSIEKNKLILTHSRDKVFDTLERIAKDLISKTITLDNIWDNAAKRNYLDSLAKEGVLPTVQDALPKPEIAKNRTTPKSSKATQTESSESKPAEKRMTLIRNIDSGLVQSRSNRRALDIFDELQHRLKFEQHDNAIAVLFRVLVELSIDHYIQRSSLSSVHPNDSLAKKYPKVLDDMLASKIIDKKRHAALLKFSNSAVLFSTNTMNSYVHSGEFFPSDIHLKSMWDSLESFVIECLKPKDTN